MSFRKILTWTTGLTLGSISADYLYVNKYYNVNYCYENAEHDLLGTFSKRNPSEPAMCGIDHYRTVIELSKDGSFNIDQLANSFFSNPLFRMQTRLMDSQVTTEQQVDECKFEIGDKLSEFKVIEKNQDEIMLRSSDGFLLWLKLVNEQSKVQLNFGSSMLSDSPMSKLPPVVDSIVLNLHFLYARYLLVLTKKQFNSKFVKK